jgi:hypothetical protein
MKKKDYRKTKKYILKTKKHILKTGGTQSKNKRVSSSAVNTFLASQRLMRQKEHKIKIDSLILTEMKLRQKEALLYKEKMSQKVIESNQKPYSYYSRRIKSFILEYKDDEVEENTYLINLKNIQNDILRNTGLSENEKKSLKKLIPKV